MTMNPLRTNVGIAIDGGGIKGLIIARALMTLETELGCPLIKNPRIRILAGTSTGAVLTGLLALGMEAGAIAGVYREFGQQVFHRLTPAWFPRPLKSLAELFLAISRHSCYSNKKLISLLRKVIGDKAAGNPDFTLADLNERIGSDKALILTVVNITERRTHFLKSYSQADGQWKLWEAILASSSVPPALPVWSRNGAGRQYFTDGGVGSYGNPAYIVAQEATVFRGYGPSDVSILSFGTGWLNAENFERQYHSPTTWHGLSWANNAPNLFIADAIRSQSLDILENPGTSAIDFRRFQFELKEDIPAETYQDDATYTLMEQLGDEFGKRIVNNQFASERNPQYDPEGLYAHRAKYRVAKRLGKHP